VRKALTFTSHSKTLKGCFENLTQTMFALSKGQHRRPRKWDRVDLKKVELAHFG